MSSKLIPPLLRHRPYNILAASSMGSCSPPPPYKSPSRSQRRTKKDKMPKSRANWIEQITRTFLELCVREKNKLNWEGKILNRVGWGNVYPEFNLVTRVDRERKSLHNKLGNLSTHFIKWRDLNFKRSGLGCDKATGSVSVDPAVWGSSQEGNSQRSTPTKDKEEDIDPRRPPPCVDLLFDLFGHLLADKGALLTTSGHREETPPADQAQTPPPEMGEPSSTRSQGVGSKRTREREVISPMKKANAATIVESLASISETFKTIQQTYALDAMQMARVCEVLIEDGISEASDEYSRAAILCKNPLDRQVFLTMKSKEGCLKWIQVAWDDRQSANMFGAQVDYQK